VAIAKLTDSPRIGALSAVAILAMLLGLWYGYRCVAPQGSWTSSTVRR